MDGADVVLHSRADSRAGDDLGADLARATEADGIRHLVYLGHTADWLLRRQDDTEQAIETAGALDQPGRAQ